VWQSTELKGAGDLKSFDIRHGDAEFGVCPAGFWSYLGPAFPHCVPFPPIWDINPVPRYVEICDLVFFVFCFVETRFPFVDQAGLRLT